MIPVYTIIGAGGTGSILLEPLVRLLATRYRNEPHIIAVIDGDHVEPKNLDRQLFDLDQLQLNKAEALVTRVRSDRLRAVPHYLDEASLEDRIREHDTILICADNYDVRRRIERRALTLDNITIINGGNEAFDGSTQIFIRQNGENVTPPLSFQHPEILTPSPHDPTALSCSQRAELPGGEQTIVANMLSAANILAALTTVHTWRDASGPGFDFTWTQLFFDARTGSARGEDLRALPEWQTYIPQEATA